MRRVKQCIFAALRKISLLAVLACASGWTFAAPSLNEDLLDIQFIDSQLGWASGRWGTIMHTRDGGRSWERQKTNVDFTLSSVHFTDALHGWAVGDEGTIIHTADGGKTWAQQRSPVRHFLMRVHFRNQEVGWIVGEHTHILHTKDGGATWTVQFSGGDFVLKSLSFADDKAGWAVGEYGYIFRTSDAGKTWSRQAGHFGMSERTGEIIGGSFLFDVHAVSDRVAWVVGIDGYVARTEDGGATWREVNIGAPKTQLFSIASSKSGALAVVGNGVVMISGDGGNSWKPGRIKPSLAYGWLYRIGRRADGLASVGWRGAIYLSDAGADNWQRVGP